MKSYFLIICKYLHAFIPVFLLLLAAGCQPGLIMPRQVDIFTEKPLQPYYGTGTLVILPFDSAEMKPDLGIAAGRLFEEEITKKKRLRQVSCVEDVSWEKQLTGREQKIRAALAAAREHNADLLLWGTIEDFLPGTATETVVTLNVMLLSVSQGTVLWWGRDKAVGKPGNTFLYLGQRTSPDAPAVDRVLSGSARKIVNAMFPDAAAGGTVRYLRHMAEKLFSGQPAAASAPAEAPDHEPAADHDMARPGDPQETGAAPSEEREKDILDTAIEELDAAE